MQRSTSSSQPSLMGWMMECASMRRERAMVLTEVRAAMIWSLLRNRLKGSSTGEPDSSATLVSLST